MDGIMEDIVKNEAQGLVDIVKSEAKYVCRFNSYVATFERKKNELVAKFQDVNRKIEEARGVFKVTNEALEWTKQAENLIHVDAKKEKCLDLCLKCWGLYWKGRDMEEKTQLIKELLERCNFDIVAGPANLPRIKYRTLPNFMPFKSRESKLTDLKEALEDENCNMIGLQGLGGTGKTSMAIQVSAELEGPKFGQVILLTVSKTPDFKKLRGKIARHLNLKLDDGEEEEQQEKILSKITCMKEELLIILDDVWEKFELVEKLGIPSYHHHKGCSVLITTRNSHVCEEMDCQKEIHLETLTDEEALTLFLEHAIIKNSSSLKGVAQKIVKHCHGVPVVIVAVARSLNGRLSNVWKDALITLEKGKSILKVDQDLLQVYDGLKLSYDQLKDEKAKELFLIVSLFPEDFEYPMELLSRIGMGMGLFGDVDEYSSERRKKALDAIKELQDSSLLMNAENECVTMHDLIREVGLLIGDKDMQLIMDSKLPVKKDLRYLCWLNNDFLNEFDGRKLEFLWIWPKGSEDLNVLDTLFVEMTRLKVLVLVSGKRMSAPALSNSLQSLKDIQMLTLVDLKLGDISILGNLASLQTLWLQDCSIDELPIEFLKLKKLRLLDVSKCKIERNNPFKVIQRCSQLEELNFVDNIYEKGEKNEVSHNVSPPTLQRYEISSTNFSKYFERYGSISRCFQAVALKKERKFWSRSEAEDLRQLMSEATFKQLVGTTELLIFEGYEGKRWNNLIPDIVPVVDGKGMDDLMILHLSYRPDFDCLIDTNNYYSDVLAFPNLVELHLESVGVEDLYRGSLPSCFLEQLKIMKLKDCPNLKNMLFNGNLNLRFLISIKLEDCPALRSIFQPSTAQSLMLLEELKIGDCDELEYIITDESSEGEIASDDGDDDQKCYDSVFPKLKTLKIEICNKLKVILPLFAGGHPFLEEISIWKCKQLKYIFDKFQEWDHVMLPSLKQIKLSEVPSLIGIYREFQLPLLKQMELSEVPSFIGIYRESQKPISSSIQKPLSPLSRYKSEEIFRECWCFSWLQLFCSLNKSTATNEETNVAVSEETLREQAIPQEIHASINGILPFKAARSLSIQSLINVKEIELVNCTKLKSVLTLPSASTILLEKLTIEICHQLKYIVVDEGDAGSQMNHSSIFPKLKYLYVSECNALEYIVIAYAFRYQTCVDFPALEELYLRDVPNLVSIYPKNYCLLGLSLRSINLGETSPEFTVRSFTHFMVCGHANQQDFTTSEAIEMRLQALESLIITNSKIEHIFCLIHLEVEDNKKKLEPLTSSLQYLLLSDLSELRNICAGTKNILSLNNLSCLDITACKRLRFVFSASILRSLPKLESLRILDCEELVHIIEEDNEQHVGDHLRHEPCFPNLLSLSVEHCVKLKYLFSITVSGILPNLKYLGIREACELKHVLIRRDETKEMATKDVLPKLRDLELVNLPILASLCHGVDFQDLSECASVDHCPNFSLYAKNPNCST